MSVISKATNGQQRAQSSYVKKRIFDKINDMNEQQFDSVSQNMNLEEKDDKESVITQDKLKKFNEINGYENGPAIEQEEEDEVHELASN